MNSLKSWVPISRTDPCEVEPDDAIVEAPSLVTPLLLKKRAVSRPTSDEAALKDYIRSTTVASLTNAKASNILIIEDYYRSSVGELLLGIGLSRVRQATLDDSVKKLATKIRKDSDDSDGIAELEAQKKQLLQTRASNKAYEAKAKNLMRCPHCPFKCEFSAVLESHLEIPHMNRKREYMCNWCSYKDKDSNQILFHSFFEHKKRCRIEKPPSNHNCQYCPYESKSKRKITSHNGQCEKFFPHDSFLGPEDYGADEFPAITSKLITQEDVKTYEQTLKSLRLAAYNPHQLKVSESRQKLPVRGADSAAISSSPNSKGSTFVICEICDGYIKDLNHLKSHMQWIHKVKLHQKTLESRPPLRCQKCQWRFFTDQGLERHLLGAHGLVTSNMQNQVEGGTDSGRCTICGRAYASKLVAHMREIHNVNLKPAHLSYKCTVCSATFNLYRLFENHVYSVHSESVRRNKM